MITIDRYPFRAYASTGTLFLEHKKPAFLTLKLFIFTPSRTRIVTLRRHGSAQLSTHLDKHEQYSMVMRPAVCGLVVCLARRRAPYSTGDQARAPRTAFETQARRRSFERLIPSGFSGTGYCVDKAGGREVV